MENEKSGNSEVVMPIIPIESSSDELQTAAVCLDSNGRILADFSLKENTVVSNPDSLNGGFVLVDHAMPTSGSISPSDSSNFVNMSKSNGSSIPSGLIFNKDEMRLYSQLNGALLENGKLKTAMIRNNKIVKEQVERFQNMVQTHSLKMREMSQILKKEKDVSDGLRIRLSEVNNAYAAEKERSNEVDVINELVKSQNRLESDIRVIVGFIEEMKERKDILPEEGLKSMMDISNQFTPIQATQEQLNTIVTALSGKSENYNVSQEIVKWKQKFELSETEKSESRFKIHEKEEEIALLHSEIERLKHDKEVEIAVLLSKIERANLELDTKEKVLQDKLSSQLIQEQMFCQRLSEAHNEIEKYQNATISNSDMLGENDKLKEKISLLKDLNSKDSDRINELMNTIEALKKESREKDTWSLIGGPESNMDALIKEENAVLRNDNNNIKDENTSLREEIAEMKLHLNQIEEAKHLQDDNIKQLYEENADLERQLQSLNPSNEACMSDRNEFNKLQKAAEEKDIEIQNLYQLAESKNNQVEALKLENDKITKERDNLMNNMQGLSHTHEKQRIDFEELWKNYQVLRSEHSGLQSNVQHFQEEADKSKADAFGAKELIKKLQDEWNKAKQGNQVLEEAIKKLKEECDMIPSMRIQLDTFEHDFNAERESKMTVHEEMMKGRERINELELENRRLTEDLEKHNTRNMTEFQRRHTNPQSFQSMQQQQRLSQGGNHRNPDMQNAYSTQPADNSTYHARGVASRHISSNQQSRSDESGRRCPKCHKMLPDLDSLQIHVMDCLDN